jgi:heptosyltransferase-2
MLLSSTASDLLVLRLSSFGDIVLAEPVTRALRNRFQNSRIWFVVDRRLARLPYMFPSVDRVVDWDRTGGNEDYERLAGETEFELAVDLQNSFRSRRITRGLSIRHLVRFRRQRFRRFFCVHAPWLWKGPLKHTTEAYCDTIRGLGIAAGDCVPVMEPPPDRMEQMRQRIGAGIAVGVCPGGSSEHKRWGEAKFAELIRLLASRGRRTVLIGAETDRPVVDAVRDMTVGTSVDRFIADDADMIASALSLCDVVVANDSGLMHLAGAVGSKVVGLFGPTSPILGFAPKAQCSVVVTCDLPCSPCSYHGNKPCKLGRAACMDGIDAAEVAEVVGRLLSEGRGYGDTG